MTRDENDGLTETSSLTSARIITDKMNKMLHGHENSSKGALQVATTSLCLTTVTELH
jgi:hypothetical protein